MRHGLSVRSQVVPRRRSSLDEAAFLFAREQLEGSTAMTTELRPPVALDLAEKNFRPSAVEADLYAWWEERLLHARRGSTKKPFVMILPLPHHRRPAPRVTRSGSGGYKTSCPATTACVEPTLYMPGRTAGSSRRSSLKELAKEWITRQQLSREKFLGEMWKWMDHYRPRIEKSSDARMFARLVAPELHDGALQAASGARALHSLHKKVIYTAATGSSTGVSRTRRRTPISRSTTSPGRTRFITCAIPGRSPCRPGHPT